MDTQSRYLRVRREDIAYFKFIIESYEGMAVVRTKDRPRSDCGIDDRPGMGKGCG